MPPEVILPLLGQEADILLPRRDLVRGAPYVLRQLPPLLADSQRENPDAEKMPRTQHMPEKTLPQSAGLGRKIIAAG